MDAIASLRKGMKFGPPRKISNKASWVDNSTESSRTNLRTRSSLRGRSRSSVGRLTGLGITTSSTSTSSSAQKRKRDEGSAPKSGTMKRSKSDDGHMGAANPDSDWKTTSKTFSTSRVLKNLRPTAWPAGRLRHLAEFVHFFKGKASEDPLRAVEEDNKNKQPLAQVDKIYDKGWCVDYSLEFDNNSNASDSPEHNDDAIFDSESADRITFFFVRKSAHLSFSIIPSQQPQCSLLCKASVANIPGGIARLLEPNPCLYLYPRRRDARPSKDLSAPALRVEPPGGDGQSQRNKRMGTRIPRHFRTLDPPIREIQEA